MPLSIQVVTNAGTATDTSLFKTWRVSNAHPDGARQRTALDDYHPVLVGPLDFLHAAQDRDIYSTATFGRAARSQRSRAELDRHQSMVDAALAQTKADRQRARRAEPGTALAGHFQSPQLDRYFHAADGAAPPHSHAAFLSQAPADLGAYRGPCLVGPRIPVHAPLQPGTAGPQSRSGPHRPRGHGADVSDRK